MASKTRGPARTHNGHHAPVDAGWKSSSAPAAKPRVGKDKGKKKRDKHAQGMQANAPDKAAAALPPASRGLARVLKQTVGDPPTPWPIYLLRQGLLLMVDGIDARYGTGTAGKDEAVRAAGSRPPSAEA